MLRLSWSSFVERWALFVGALVTVCFGVALVQSSLLVLISAATYQLPADLSVLERARYGEGTAIAITLSALTLAFSAFLAVFIVSSTFAFTVAQRRRDLALLRLVGGSRRQLHRLLVGEAVLLGGLGAALGIPVGLVVMRFQSGLLTMLGFAPPGFAAEWRNWILGVSAGVGIGVALAGVLVAASRAARVQPLEALRDTGESARVMTVGRWVIAGVFAAGAIALVVLAPIGGAGGAPPMAINAALCASVAMSAISPVLVPVVSRLLPSGAGVITGLAGANLRDGVRRSAATAAPLIVLVGLVLGQSVALASFASAGELDQRASTVADLVVEADGPVGPRVAAVAGVAAHSTEVEVPVTVTFTYDDDVDVEGGSGLVVDPVAYARFHPGTDAVAGLGGNAVVAGPGRGAGTPGSSGELRIGDTAAGPLHVVAEVPSRTGGGADLLLPGALVPADLLAQAPSRTFVELLPGADPATVAGALAGIGEVSTLDAWASRDAAARNATSISIFLVVMGLGAAYAVIGVINAGVIGAAARRTEFAVLRSTGLTRMQVVRAALVESLAVTGIGLLLGVGAAAGTFVAVAMSTAAMIGIPTITVPWAFVIAVGVGAVAICGVTSVITTVAGTRGNPVSLLAARE
ncbi:ABC transporter permease [Pseudonocardia sp. TRM90224]|uniref:ABC transporter permease n=1 Tax=Pseudonocardia sp. TRM90224 TaxID=2812678 RepID=UPI001E2FAAA8|nr:ABC transporter permease [Pseudonocardia sp. TRM90224]